MTLYKNKYRIESPRCQSWDYASNGYYFVTICTHNRQHFFCDVVKDKITKSLGSIIGQIKSVCTKRIWEAGFDDFDWQDRFYDHIIQSEESLHNIREYIINNPVKWEFDKNNPANLYM